MEIAITPLSICPIRSRPDDCAEMSSQLLFGESVEVMEKTKSPWLKVRCLFDGYEGWMDSKQLESVTDVPESKSVSIELAEPIFGDGKSTFITIGAELPNFDGMTATFNNTTYRFSGQAVREGETHDPITMLDKLSRKLINSPYLWGGRSPFGIDCSGFTQILFKCIGIRLKRDSFDQAEQGTVVDFLEQSKPGDLAFFSKEKSSISHVGLILDDSQIIHACGKVRIDMIDHYGIFNKDMQEYTHRLKIIKRLINR